MCVCVCVCVRVCVFVSVVAWRGGSASAGRRWPCCPRRLARVCVCACECLWKEGQEMGREVSLARQKDGLPRMMVVVVCVCVCVRVRVCVYVLPAPATTPLV